MTNRKGKHYSFHEICTRTSYQPIIICLLSVHTHRCLSSCHRLCRFALFALLIFFLSCVSLHQCSLLYRLKYNKYTNPNNLTTDISDIDLFSQKMDLLFGAFFLLPFFFSIKWTSLPSKWKSTSILIHTYTIKHAKRKGEWKREREKSAGIQFWNTCKSNETKYVIGRIWCAYVMIANEKPFSINTSLICNNTSKRNAIRIIMPFIHMQSH